MSDEVRWTRADCLDDARNVTGQIVQGCAVVERAATACNTAHINRDGLKPSGCKDAGQIIKITDATARIREQHDWYAQTVKCAFQRHVTYFDHSMLGAARSAEGARRGRQERAADDGVTHSFLPASLCSWQPSRDRRRNCFVAPLRSRTAQCASLVAPYTSLAARRIVSPTAQAPRAKDDAAISPPR